MEKRALFGSAEQAINATFHMGKRLSFLIAWCFLWLIHLTLALLVALALWLFDVRAEQALHLLQALASSTPVAVAGAVGVSAIGVVAGYCKACHWLVLKVRSGALLDYLMQDVRTKK